MSRMTSRLAPMAVAAAASVAVMGSGPATAESPYTVDWSAQIGTAYDDQGHGLAVDSVGNAYFSGHTFGSLDGTNAGALDAFLTRVDASGNVVWTRQFGTLSTDGGSSVAVDGSGNAYITGVTGGSLGGAVKGTPDAYLIKVDSLGNQVWSRQIGTTKGDDGEAVAVDGLGNIYVTGSTVGSFPGYGNQGYSDSFLVKLDASGNELWTRQIGTQEDDNTTSIAVDSIGNVYISGYTDGNFGGTNAGGYDAFLTKFDASGNQVWARQIGTTEDDRSQAVAVDGAGTVYISGITTGSLGGANMGGRDAFLIKYDTSGNQVWARQIGTNKEDRSYAVAIDGAGNAFISGFTDGSLGGTNPGFTHAYLTKFDAAGNELWSELFGTQTWDESNGLAMDSAGNVYSTGLTYGNLGGPNAGGQDAFLVKFAVPEPASLGLLALGGLALLRRRC